MTMDLHPVHIALRCLPYPTLLDRVAFVMSGIIVCSVMIVCHAVLVPTQIIVVRPIVCFVQQENIPVIYLRLPKMYAKIVHQIRSL